MDSGTPISNGLNVKNFLQSIKNTQPPWKCPKCRKLFRNYVGIEHHLLKFHHSGPSTPLHKSGSSTPLHKFPFNRKSRLKFSIKKRNNRLLRRSPSPIQLSPTRDTTTLTWAEAQQMVELESDGQLYRYGLNIL